jgi:hypothetical protein
MPLPREVFLPTRNSWTPDGKRKLAVADYGGMTGMLILEDEDWNNVAAAGSNNSPQLA